MATVKGARVEVAGSANPRSGRGKKDVPEPVYLIQHAGTNRAQRRKMGIRGPGLSSNQVYRRR